VCVLNTAAEWLVNTKNKLEIALCITPSESVGSWCPHRVTAEKPIANALSTGCV
jgi:hypothetical protein